MKRKLSHIALILGLVLSSIACEKKSTSSVNRQSAQPNLQNPLGQSSNADANCTVDGASLRLQGLPPIDASKLIVKDLADVRISYGSEEGDSSLIIAFDAPASETDPNYVADYGLITIWNSDKTKKVFERKTAKYSEVIPIPPAYREQKLTIEVRACVEPERQLTKDACGAQFLSKIIKEKAVPAGAENVAKLNMQLRQNEDERGLICEKLKKTAQEFLAAIDKKDPNGNRQAIIAVAELIAFHPAQFGAICSSEIIDQMVELQEAVAKDPELQQMMAESQGQGLALQGNCVSAGVQSATPAATPNSATPETKAVTPKSEIPNADNEHIADEDTSKDDADKNSESSSSSSSSEAGAEQKSCEAKADEGFSWDATNKFCVKVENFIIAANSKEQCQQMQGVWDDAKKICKITPTMGSYFTWHSSIIPEYDNTKCLTAKDGGPLGVEACAVEENDAQLFVFESHNEGSSSSASSSSSAASKTVVIKNDKLATPSCLRLTADHSGVENSSCEEITEEHQFYLVKRDYDSASYYMIIPKVDNKLCFDKGGSALKVANCVSQDSFSAKKKQLFTIKANGGPREGKPVSTFNNFASLVAEYDESGAKCLQVADDAGQDVKVVECSKEEAKQHLNVEKDEFGNISVKTSTYRVETDGQKRPLCFDYSRGTEGEDGVIGAFVCSDTLKSQKFAVVKFSDSEKGSFYKIKVRDSAVTGDLCLTVQSAKVGFADCKDGNYGLIKDQLFTLQAGGGKRGATEEDKDSGKKGHWYEKVSDSKAWKIGGGLLIGAGLLAVGFGAKSVITKSSISADDMNKWVAKNTSSVLDSSDVSKINGAAVKVKGDKLFLVKGSDEVEITRGLNNGNVDIQGKLGTSSGTAININTNKVMAIDDIKTSTPAKGKKGAYAGIFAGLVAMGSGILINVLELATVPCEVLAGKNFLQLDIANRYQKFNCEVTTAEQEIAKLRVNYEAVEKYRDLELSRLNIEE